MLNLSHNRLDKLCGLGSLPALIALDLGACSPLYYAAAVRRTDNRMQITMRSRPSSRGNRGRWASSASCV